MAIRRIMTDTSPATDTGRTATASAPPSPSPKSRGAVSHDVPGDRVDASAIMASKPWGRQAAANATRVGVTPAAVAATCVIENNCENTRAGRISGAFQMLDATYRDDMRSLASERPELASSIDTSLAGKTQPANEAFAAAQELARDARALRTPEHLHPTFLDVRGAYNFGPAAGIKLEEAPAAVMMHDVLDTFSMKTLRANGISATETVAEWRDAIEKRVGTVAHEPVERSGDSR